MTCGSCGAENAAGRKFCTECGAALAVTCAVLRGGARRDGEVLRRVRHPADRRPRPLRRPTAPAAERKLVSVLFADLVGFTSLSEQRDSEDTRELLSRYFDTCRRLIELYGGTVEKFIGDAVMAVWGTPTATEDDAERAVRAALDLVAAVSALGDEVGHAGASRPRRSAHGRGGGDARRRGRGHGRRRPRQHRLADPVARRARHRVRRRRHPPRDRADDRLRGRGQPRAEGEGRPDAALARAPRRLRRARLAEVGRPRGAVRRPRPRAAPDQGPLPRLRRRGEGAPRLDHRDRRDRQVAARLGVLQVLRRDRPARPTGIAAAASPTARASRTGRSRTWSGCARGSPRTRSRAPRSPSSPRSSRSTFPTPRSGASSSRGWRTCSALDEESGGYEREDLFAAWRLFFERLTGVYPVVMLFEDMQWADASLLDFIEYLLEWGRNSPILVVTQARPELLERRPTWGAGHRNFSSIYLEPLSPEAMEELLAGLVPGLPDELRTQILARAEGDPALRGRDRAHAARPGRARPGGARLPADRHDRVARSPRDPARADRRAAGRPPAGGAPRRAGRGRARQDVHEAGARVAGGAARRRARADPLLARAQGGLRRAGRPALARARPVRLPPGPPAQGRLRDPGEGATGRRGTSPPPPSSSRRCAEQEVVEVVASHYLAAYEAAPDAPDAAGIRTKAGERLARAGERAASLGANEEAERYFSQAAELEDDPVAKATLHERAGRMAWRGARAAEATSAPRAGVCGLRGRGAAPPGGPGLGPPCRDRLPRGPSAGGGRAPRGRARDPGGRGAGRGRRLRGRAARALPRAQPAARPGRSAARGRARARRGAAPPGGLRAGADEQVAPLLAAEPARGGAHPARGRARARPRPRPARRRVQGDEQPRRSCYESSDQYAEAAAISDRGLELARRVGDRVWEELFLLGPISALVLLGRWDAALAREIEAAQEALQDLTLVTPLVMTECARGDIAAGEEPPRSERRPEGLRRRPGALRVPVRRGARAAGRGQAAGGTLGARAGARRRFGDTS